MEGLPPLGEKLSLVGKEVARVDGYEIVTGKAKYTFDIELPEMLYGKILRSPLPYARIKRIDTTKAEALPGVKKILTYKNSPRIPWYNGKSFLFDTTLRLVGDEVAAVAALNKSTAQEALNLIEVEYEELPFVLDVEEAMKPAAPKIHPTGNLAEGNPEIYQRGDLEEGLAEADIIVEDTFKTQINIHLCLETHGSVAQWEEDFLTVWDSTQGIFRVRDELASYLNHPINKIKVIKQYMGGGFGSKNHCGKYTVIAALLAKETGRAVKIFLDRQEDSMNTGNRPSSIQYIKAGLKRDGTLTSLYLNAKGPVGAFDFSSGWGRAIRELYLCKNVKTEEYNVYINGGQAQPTRAPGCPDGIFALESFMDIVAEKLEMDPLELRQKNYTTIDQVGNKPYSSKGLLEAYKIGAQRIGWEKREKRPRKGNKRRGIGMASGIWIAGAGGPPAYAILKLNPDGTANLLTGTQDIGTGTKTIMCQIAAEELGISLDDITITIGDTETTPYTGNSWGSFTAPSVGPAVRRAAAHAKEQILQGASSLLKVNVNLLEVKDGRVFVKGDSQRSISFKEVIKGMRGSMIIGMGYREPNPEDVSIKPFGAQFAEVEVDLEIGKVKVVKIVAVHECGRAINPALVRSQIYGGVIQGIGYALMEEKIMDSGTGRMVNTNMYDYKIPAQLDIPEIDVVILDMVDPVCNSLGAKGIGEPPIIPTAAAIANAIYNATGIRIKELPITQDKIIKALKVFP